MSRQSSPPPAPVIPLVRGKALRSDVRKLGAQLAFQWLRQAVADQGLSQRFLASQLEVDATWVERVLKAETSLGIGDAFVLPRTLRRALGLALLLSAENDNGRPGHK